MTLFIVWLSAVAKNEKRNISGQISGGIDSEWRESEKAKGKKGKRKGKEASSTVFYSLLPSSPIFSNLLLQMDGIWDMQVVQEGNRVTEYSKLLTNTWL